MQSKERVCLTLSPDLIRLLDSKVDGVKIRNRSHAVEATLQEHFHQTLDQAVVFANFCSLFTVHGKASLLYQLEFLLRSGFNKILVCDLEGRDDEMIKILGMIPKVDRVKLEFLNMKTTTVEVLLACREKLLPKMFMVMYGDVMTRLDLTDFIDFHRSHGRIGTIAVTSVLDPTFWGVVRMQRSRITHFDEKPKKLKRLTHLINAGIGIFEPLIFAYLGGGRDHLSRHVLPQLAEQGELFGYLLDDIWLNVRSEEMRGMAETEKEGFFWV